MTNKEFETLLTDLNKAHVEHDNLLKKAEEEYKRRFGHYPSEVDDDYWIDSFHDSPAGSSLKDVIKSAKSRSRYNRY